MRSRCDGGSPLSRVLSCATVWRRGLLRRRTPEDRRPRWPWRWSTGAAATSGSMPTSLPSRIFDISTRGSPRMLAPRRQISRAPAPKTDGAAACCSTFSDGIVSILLQRRQELRVSSRSAQWVVPELCYRVRGWHNELLGARQPRSAQPRAVESAGRRRLATGAACSPAAAAARARLARAAVHARAASARCHGLGAGLQHLGRRRAAEDAGEDGCDPPVNQALSSGLDAHSDLVPLSRGHGSVRTVCVSSGLAVR